MNRDNERESRLPGRDDFGRERSNRGKSGKSGGALWPIIGALLFLLLGLAGVNQIWGGRHGVSAVGNLQLSLRRVMRPSQRVAPSIAPVPVAALTPLPQNPLTPLPSGPGLVVCEPVAPANTSAQIADFGAGCARWLQLEAGGQGELGKTPRLGLMHEARREMQKPSARLAFSDAATLARKLGATHVVVGSIAGTPTVCTLTLRLHQVPIQGTPRALGTSLTASGTPTAVAGKLPLLAKNLAQQLGVKIPRVAATSVAATSVSDAELALMGRVPLGDGKALTRADAARFEGLARRVPLAALLYLNTVRVAGMDLQQIRNSGEETRDAPEVGRVVSHFDLDGPVKAVLKSASDNVLAMGEIGWLLPSRSLTHGANMKALTIKYPNNALLIGASLERARVLDQRKNERLAAEQFVRANPQLALAWAQLSYSVGNEAGDVRQGRFSTAMSAPEWKFLGSLYARSQQLAQKACTLDRQSALSWFALAIAATLNSDATGADQALTRALAIDPNNARFYNWGLEIYQPKWYNDRDKLLQTASQIKAHPEVYAVLYEPVMFAMRYSRMGGKLPALRQEVQQFFDSLPAGNAQAEYHLGFLHWKAERYDQALPHYQLAVKLNPRHAAGLAQLASILHYQKQQYNQAFPLYQRAVQLDPYDDRALTGLADLTMWVKNDLPGAEKLYRRAIAAKPNDGFWHANLARCLLKQNRRAEAVAAGQQAVALGENAHPILVELGL